MKRASFVVLALLAGCSQAEVSSREHTDRKSSAVLDGKTDETETATVAIFIAKTEAFPQGGFCTGALIAPNVVVTARHCVSALDNHGPPRCTDSETEKAQRSGPPVAAKDVSVVSTTNAYDSTDRPQNPAPVSRVIVLPDSLGAINCGHDIALLQLAKPVTTRPYEPRLDGPPAVHDRFTSVGYGYDGPRLGDGIRRSRHGLVVTGVGEKRDALGDVQRTESEWIAAEGPCQGDSGGPALDEAGRLIGVVTRGTMTCENQIFTRVDSYADWLRSSVIEASRDGSVDAPEWTKPAAVPDAGAEAATPASDTPASSTSGCATAPRGDADASLLVVVLAAACVLRWRARRPASR